MPHFSHFYIQKNVFSNFSFTLHEWTSYVSLSCKIPLKYIIGWLYKNKMIKQHGYFLWKHKFLRIVYSNMLPHSSNCTSSENLTAKSWSFHLFICIAASFFLFTLASLHLILCPNDMEPYFASFTSTFPILMPSLQFLIFPSLLLFRALSVCSLKVFGSPAFFFCYSKNLSSC